MNIDEKPEIPDIAIATWPETTLISRKTMTARHLRRRRAYGRTWTQLARDNFLASFPPGIPPWACEALKPAHRPRTATLEELLATYTEDERAT